MGVCSLPRDLIQEALRPEDRVQHHLQVVRRRRIAVQVQASRRRQHPVQLHQPRRHHHQVRHHLVRADHPAQRPDHRADVTVDVGDQLRVELLGGLVPVPSVVEGGDLRLGFLTRLVPEQDVVRSVGIERGVEVNEVDRGSGDVPSEDVQVVAVVESVGGRRSHGNGKSLIVVDTVEAVVLIAFDGLRWRAILQVVEAPLEVRGERPFLCNVPHVTIMIGYECPCSDL